MKNSLEYQELTVTGHGFLWKTYNNNNERFKNVGGIPIH